MVNIVKSVCRSRLFILAFASLFLAACGGIDADDRQLVERAKDYLGKNNMNAAAIELRNALQGNPGNAEARYLLGRISLDYGDFPTAEKEFRRAGESGWDEAEVLTGLARAYLGQNHFKVLLKDVQDRDSWPATVRATLLGLRAAAEAGLGNLEQAGTTVAAAAILDADAEQVLKANIQLQILQGHLGAARDILGRALDLYPDEPGLLLMMASLHKNAHELSAAEAVYQKIIDLDPPGFMSVYGWRARLELVQLLILRRALAEAETNIKPLYRRNPRDPFTNYLGSVLAFVRQDYDGSEERLLKVLKLAPEHNPTRLLFGTVNYAQEDYEQAAYFLSKYLAAVPDNVFARKLLGRSYLMLGQHDLAQEILQTAPGAEAADAELLALVSLSDLQRGRTDAGIAGLEKAVAAAPESLALRGELARAYINVGETGLAIKELKEILAKEGGQQQAETLLVLANLRAGEYAQAINLVLDMVSGSPEDPVIVTLAGNVFAASGDSKEARRYFSKALQLRPDFQPATMALARLEELDGNTSEALALYGGLVKTSNEPVVPMLALARLAEQRGDFRKMVSWLQQAREAAPGEIGPRVFLAEYYLREQQLEDARHLLAEAVEISPDVPAVLALQGKLFMAEGRFQEALAPLSELASAQPGLITIRLQHAECLMRLGRLPEAREELRFVLDQHGENITAQALMASLELQQGNPVQALEYSKRIQQAYPELYLGYELAGDAWTASRDYEQAGSHYAEAWDRMQNAKLLIKIAETHVRLGDTAAAVRQLRLWLADHASDAGVRQHLGVVYQNLGQDEKAIEEYEKVLEVDPGNQLTLNNLAWLYMQAEDSRALALAERAYRADPDNPGVMDTYGWVQLQQGQPEQGLRLLKRAVAQLSEVPEVRYHYAVALFKTGNRQEARQLISKLLSEGEAFEGRDDALRLLAD